MLSPYFLRLCVLGMLAHGSVVAMDNNNRALHVVAQQEDLEPPQSRFGCDVTKPFYLMGSGLLWPFKKIGRAFTQGAEERIMERIQGPPVRRRGNVAPGNLPGNPEALNHSTVETVMHKAVATFFTEMSKATDPRAPQAPAAQVIRNIFNASAITMADLYNPEGEGRKALENLFRSFQAFMSHEGVIQDTVRSARLLVFDEFVELLKDIEKLNKGDGGARNAVHAVADNIAHGVDRVGESVDSSSRKVVRNVLIGGVLIISSWFLWRHVERNLIKPRLVLETSRKNFFTKLGAYLFGEEKRATPELIFSAELQARLTGIATAARFIKDRIKEGATNVKYRNLLLWGPPGTGKTMFARLLAQHSGMDYVIMSGSSFAQYRNGEGITEMNKLFEWAKTCSDGLILFIDEAESFLGGRVSQDVTKESYQLLTNFLNLTGERSDKIMLVFATNHAKALDEAMKRRIDDAVEISLPHEEQRASIIKLYRDKLMLKTDQGSDPFKESVQKYFSDDVIMKIAFQTEGLSGGELEGIVNSLISDASVTSNGLLTEDLVHHVVTYALEKHQSFMTEFASRLPA